MIPFILAVFFSVLILCVILFYVSPKFRKFARDSEVTFMAAATSLFGLLSGYLDKVDPSDLQNAMHVIVTHIGADQYWYVYLIGLGFFLYFIRWIRESFFKNLTKD